MSSLFSPILVGILPAYLVKFSLFGIHTNFIEVGIISALVWGVFHRKIRTSWYSWATHLPKGVLVATAMFVLSAIISTIISHEIKVSLGILKSWILMPLILSILVGSSVYKNPETKKKIIQSLILSGVMIASIGIFQTGFMPRVMSIYDVPNSLALFLVPIAIIALYTGVQSRNRLYIFYGILMFIAILATKSFGAVMAIVGTMVIGLGAGVPLPLIRGRVGVGAGQGSQHLTSPPPSPLPNWGGGSYAILLLISLALLFLLPRLPYLISPFIHPNTSNSVTVRLQLWDIGIRLITQHPVLGIGLGQFEPAYQLELHQLFKDQKSLAVMPDLIGHPRRNNLIPEFVFRDPHNFIISFWLNLGIAGLLSFCFLNFIAIRRSIQSKDIENRAIGLAIISILLFGLVDTIYWKNDLSALWWMLILLLI